MINKEEADKKFSADLFATKMAGIVIEEASHGYAKCRMDITENHLNAAGVVMGGAIFTLADFTSAVATNNLEEPTVSLTSSIEFIAAGRGACLYAEGRMVKEGRICFFEVSVTDEGGKLIAKASGNGYRMDKR